MTEHVLHGMRHLLRSRTPVHHLSGRDNLARSADFYEKVGFREIGRVASADGSILLMLNLPGDGEVVTLELVSDPRLDPLEIGDGFSHLAVQVDDLAATLADLTRKGIEVDGPHHPGGEAGPTTAD